MQQESTNAYGIAMIQDKEMHWLLQALHKRFPEARGDRYVGNIPHTGATVVCPRCADHLALGFTELVGSDQYTLKVVRLDVEFYIRQYHEVIVFSAGVCEGCKFLFFGKVQATKKKSGV